MGELVIGDNLFDENGNVINVTWVSSVMTGHPCYKLNFSDGTSIIADEEHKWVTTTKDERAQQKRRTSEWRKNLCEKRRPDSKREFHDVELKTPPVGKIRTTKEIFNTLKLKDGEINHAIDVCLPVKIDKKRLSVDPYVLGAWLGDGTKSCGAICSADEEIIRNIKLAGYSVKKQKSYLMWNIQELRSQLHKSGILNKKHIPQEYLRSSFDQRLALLQGLMDTDGSVSHGQCLLSLTNRRLIDDAIELIKSLGIKVKLHIHRSRIGSVIFGECYRIGFSSSLPIFRLKRKLDLQKRGSFNGKQGRHYIVDVSPVDSVPVRCIKVNSLSQCFLAGESFIKTHNTDLRDTTIKTFFEICPNELIKSYNKTEHHLILKNNSEIYFRELKDRSGLGSLELGWFYIDEAEEVAEEVYLYLKGRLSSKKTKRHCGWLTSNPPNEDHWLYRHFQLKETVDGELIHASTYENKEHLPTGYIEGLEIMPEAWRKKYLMGQWGFTPDGEPFYQGFKESLHVKDLSDFKPSRIYRGWDYGFHHPACVLTCFDDKGRWLILREIMGDKIIVNQFRDYVKNKCVEWYPTVRDWVDYGDPAGEQKNDKSEKTSVEILAEGGVFVISKASTYRERKEIIERKLSTLVGGTPAIVINSCCKIITDGFLGGYHYATRRAGQAFNAHLHEVPFRDGFWEHVMNSMEYVAVHLFTGAETTEDNTPTTYRVVGDLGDVRFDAEDSGEKYSPAYQSTR